MEFKLLKTSGNYGNESPTTIKIDTLEELLEFIKQLQNGEDSNGWGEQVIIGVCDWDKNYEFFIEIYDTYRE